MTIGVLILRGCDNVPLPFLWEYLMKIFQQV